MHVPDDYERMPRRCFVLGNMPLNRAMTVPEPDGGEYEAAAAPIHHILTINAGPYSSSAPRNTWTSGRYANAHPDRRLAHEIDLPRPGRKRRPSRLNSAGRVRAYQPVKQEKASERTVGAWPRRSRRRDQTASDVGATGFIRRRRLRHRKWTSRFQRSRKRARRLTDDQ
jgi:hypothetical protein